jgi:hypothetical protein
MTNEQRAKIVYDKVKAHLTGNDFKYECDDQKMTIVLRATGEDLPLLVFASVDADRQLIRILSPIPVKMPEDKRIEGAVASAVANYGIVAGNFDYDMSDGEIRFRVTQSFREGDVTDEIIRYMFGILFGTVDQYNDRFFMLAKGMMSLEQFIGMEGN